MSSSGNTFTELTGQLRSRLTQRSFASLHSLFARMVRHSKCRGAHGGESYIFCLMGISSCLQLVKILSMALISGLGSSLSLVSACVYRVGQKEH